MNLAFGYIRRSSYKQQENNSVEIQRAHIQEFARRKNLNVPDEFIFIEDVTSAYSKRASKRKELMRLRSMMIESNVPRVIFYEESRMDRTGYTFVLDFYRPLKEALPELEVFTTNSNDPLNPDNVQDKIALLLFRQESEIKSERALASLITDLEDEDTIRPGSKVPYGYNQVNKKLIPNEKADIVTFIYFLQSWGASMARIAAILNEAAIPSPTGGSWGSSTVENILKNQVYTGTLVWHVRKNKKGQKYEFNDFHEPLIDPFLLKLNDNNVRLQTEFGRLDTPFLFLNKLSCSECHEKLLTHNASTTRNGKKYLYQFYVCKNCSYKIDVKSAHDNLLPRIFKHVHSLMTSEEMKIKTNEYLANLEQSIKKNIINSEKLIDKVQSKGCIAKEHEDPEFESVVKSLLQRQLETLKNLVNSLKVVEELQESMHSDLFFDRFKLMLDQQLGGPEIRLIILYFIDKISVSANGLPKLFFRESVFECFYSLTTGQSTEM